MAHHAYYIAGNPEAGIENALAYVQKELGLMAEQNPDVIVLRHGLLSVDDARKVIELANQAALGEQKVIILSALRLFHEAQNALLKVFEEPPAGTTLILTLPSEGMLLATLRSRLLPLPVSTEAVKGSEREFISASAGERAKLIEKLLDRTKSDRDEEKQAARGEALELIEGLLRHSYDLIQKGKGGKELEAFASDLTRFVPILHERSAPLKLIFEHLLLTWPDELSA